MPGPGWGCLVWGVSGPGGVPGPRGCLVPRGLVWGCLVLGVCSWGVPGPSGSAPGGRSGGETPGMATAVGGTHHTGMHSCYK